MTDLIDSILSSMSSKFNDINITNINLTEDKTMKWRGMLKNKYACRRKEKNQKRNKQQQSMSSSSKSNNADTGTTSTTHQNTNDDNETTKITSTSDKKFIRDKPPVKRVLRKSTNNKIVKKIDLPKRKRRSVTTVGSSDAAAAGGSPVKRRSQTRVSKTVAIESITSAGTDVTMTTPPPPTIVVESNSEDIQFKIEDAPEIKAEDTQQQQLDLKEKDTKEQQATQPKLRRSERTHSNIDTTVVAGDIVSDSVEIVVEPTIEKIEEKPEILVTPTIESLIETVPVETKSESETSEEKVPKDESSQIQTVSQVDAIITEATTGTSILPSEPQSTTIVDVVVPKKRGRKPGTKLKPKTNALAVDSPPVKKSPRLSKDYGNDSVLASAIARREKINEKVATLPHQQRLSRRIKPTAKILANEELRYGFELQNNARLSMSSENLDKTPEETKLIAQDENDHISTITIDDEVKPEPTTPNHHNSVDPTTTPDATIAFLDQQQIHRKLLEKTPPQNSVKRLLFGQTKSMSPEANIGTLTTTTTTPTSSNHDFIHPQQKMAAQRRPCPDPVAFLNEIKMAKINLHRSPEDNKKLNLKQKRRLIKLKEKHLNKLGLQKTTKSLHNDDSSLESNESDEEDVDEFVPNKKINVGRPGVTLRVRDKRFASISTPIIQQLDNTEQNVTSIPSRSLQVTQQRKSVTPKTLSRRIETSLLLSTKHKSIPSATVTSALLQSEQQHNTNPAPPPPSIKQEQLPPTICLCNKPSKYYTQRTDDLNYCRAIDEIETKQIGCCNTVNGGDLLNLLRPSVRVSYMTLCDNHRDRLLAHNCCAGCGIFCTQGRFHLCKQNHIFHRDCAIKFILNAPFNPQMPDFRFPTLVLKCPHCGQDAPEHETIVTMQCQTMPVFAPSQRHYYTPPAKMSIDLVHRQSMAAAANSSLLPHHDRMFLLELEKLIPESVIDLIVNARENFDYRNAVNYTTKDLFFAIHENNVDRVAEIIASGFDITAILPEFHNGTCLHLVSNFGSITMTYLILSRSASVDFLNIVDRQLRSAIMCAVVANRNDILRLLVQCGADVTRKGSDGMTALHLAAKTGNFSATQIILEHYQKSSSAYNYERFLNTIDDGGWTAMVWAAEIGHSDMVSYFVNCGCDANICDAENNTALHWATMSNSIETIVPLLQSNCDYNVQNINGDTPLHISCRNSNTRICLMLLIRGASLNIKNAIGERPYDCIPNENSQCARVVLFNLKIRNVAQICGKNLNNRGVQSILCQDISNGREIHPLKIIKFIKQFNYSTENNAHQYHQSPNLPDFKYITKTIIQQSGIQIDRRISQMRICSCSDSCTTQSCQCSEISVQNWYNSNGHLNGDFNFNDPAMIFECNDVCGCNKLMCKNRVVQNGIKIPMQIVECENHIKGWGVFGMVKILKGSFIAEYTGEIITNIEADRRTDEGYYFDLGASDHCIDANYYGNVSRFFNHSCNPNIVPIRVYYEHQDLRFPKIAFFANRDIEIGDELTFDYGEKFWLIKYKSFTCQCGIQTCRYSDKTITKTLAEYNQRKSQK